MEENNTPKDSLLNKKVDDITVGDAIKINAVVLAVMAGPPLLWLGGTVAKDKFTAWKQARKDAELTLVPNEQ